MSETTTVPATITVLSGETLPISVDFSQLITTGQVPAAPTAALYDLTVSQSPGTPIVLVGQPTISGNVVTQSVTGLAAGKRYRLVLGLTAAAGIIWQAGVTIACPF